MSYRNYIGSISKFEHDIIKNFTIKQLLKSKNTDNICGFELVNQIYNFGSDVDEFNKEYFKPVFSRPSTQKYFGEELDFYIVEKEFLAEFINRYSIRIKNIYKDMLKPFFDERKPISEFLNTAEHKYDKNYREYLIGDITKITEEENRVIFKMIEHIQSFANEWGIGAYFKDHLPYSLDEKPEITNSWKFEYAQFELVRIYKTFDWDNNIMIYYGF